MSSAITSSISESAIRMLSVESRAPLEGAGFYAPGDPAAMNSASRRPGDFGFSCLGELA